MRRKNYLKWKEPFLQELRETGNVSHACRVAGVARWTAYMHRRDDDAFRQAWDEAEECATQTVLEPEAWRRAVDGVEEVVVSAGRIMGYWKDAQGNIVPEGTEGARFEPLTVRRYSDQLLKVLLVAHNPEKFSERAKYEHSGPDGGPLPITVQIVNKPAEK